MKLSSERILTTHVGSLPRPDDLFEMMLARMDGKPVDDKAYAARVQKAVSDSVRQQIELGIDVVNDGEMGKPSFITYAAQRLNGLERRAGERKGPFATSRETASFPEYYSSEGAAQVSASRRRALMVCAGPITYKGQAALKADLDALKAAVAGSGATEAFVPAIAPSNVEATTPNEYYPTPEKYVFAIAEAMREEYKAIVEAGLILQIDDPAIAENFDQINPEPTAEEYRKFTMPRIEALNHALRGLPKDRIRFHLCWGSWHGPHTTDIAMRDIVDVMLKIDAGAYSFEAGNVRHEHEWSVWRDTKLPDDRLILPGVVSHATNVVEHPDLVAERIGRFAKLVGKERVIASTDCGLGGRVYPDIAWAKLETLAQGAAIASKQLWS
jgi:5-methyltetrahydropteroyltriglutamate--homocysteine methyltransferase